ncbi:MAG TPA: hypothetical protein VFX76_06295 [Roseiflexaceae bacterium]|nr:hypothetical protein [Roseiflexaceae bacterium]
MWIRRFTAALIALLFFSSLGGGTAQAADVSPQTFTVAPGGRVQVTFVGFCIDFDRGTFPYAIQAPNANNDPALASADIQKLMAFARTSNAHSDVNKALDVQWAIWRRNGVSGISGGNDAINGANGITIVNPSGARSILEQAGWNNKEWYLDTISWSPLSKPVKLFDNAYDRFFAQGEMIVKNNTDKQLSLYVPDGTIIHPAGRKLHQRIAIYATGVQVVVMPKTAGVSIPLALAIFSSIVAGGVHLWRTRRLSLIWSRAA